MVQLVEQLLPTQEIGGSNPIIGKIYLLSTVFKNMYWKDENNEKEAGNGPFKKTLMKMIRTCNQNSKQYSLLSMVN